MACCARLPLFTALLLVTSRPALAEVLLPPLLGGPPRPDTVQTDDVRDAHARNRYQGVYARLDLLGAAFGTRAPVACERADSCDATHSYGAWAGLRIGYSFGLLGIEAAGVLIGDLNYGQGQSNALSNPQRDIGGGATRHYLHYGMGGLVGVGPRLTTKGSAVRFTVGATPGIAFRTVGTEAQRGAASSTATSSYQAFGLAADAGVELGSSPGFRLFLGLQCWADFPGASAPVAHRTGEQLAFAVTATAAPERQLYVGPVLGFALGH